MKYALIACTLVVVFCNKTFEPDLSPPEIAIIKPPDSMTSYFYYDTIYIEAVASDDHQVSHVHFCILHYDTAQGIDTLLLAWDDYHEPFCYE